MHVLYGLQTTQSYKKCICFENTPRRILEFQDNVVRSLWNVPMNIFLTSWLWPLTYDPDLYTWPRYPTTWPPCQNSSLYVCPFGREIGNRHTDGQTHDFKTITPNKSQTWGVTIFKLFAFASALALTSIAGLVHVFDLGLTTQIFRFLSFHVRPVRFNLYNTKKASAIKNAILVIAF